MNNIKIPIESPFLRCIKILMGSIKLISYLGIVRVVDIPEKDTVYGYFTDIVDCHKALKQLGADKIIDDYQWTKICAVLLYNTQVLVIYSSGEVMAARVVENKLSTIYGAAIVDDMLQYVADNYQWHLMVHGDLYRIADSFQLV